MDTSEVGIDSFRRAIADPEAFTAMGAPVDTYYSDTLHTKAFSTRDTELGSVNQLVPIAVKAFNQIPSQGQANGYTLSPRQRNVPGTANSKVSTSNVVTTSAQTNSIEKDQSVSKVARPPKKKWIKEYFGKKILLFFLFLSLN